MALGTYGIKRPADVSPADVEIVMIYTPSRDTTDSPVVKKLDANALLTPYMHNADTGGNVGTEILGGMYNLKLPANEFNEKGIYSLYLRPAEIRMKISDCGVLSSLPNVKGIVLDINNAPAEAKRKFVNQGLVGFRIEYLSDTGVKIPNFYRIVTSSFLCEAVTQNLTNSSQKVIRYRYTEAGSLIFCTVSPATAATNKPTAVPFIGNPNQDIIMTNTDFNPIMIDVEMVDYDTESLAISMFGNQTKSIEDGIYTLYDLSGQNNIYKQYNLYETRDQYGQPLYEVRQNRGLNIDFDKAFNNIV